MSRPVHAPDGAMIPGSLCEQPGDTTIVQHDVTCPDCLDLYEISPHNWAHLARTTIELRSPR